MNMNSFLVPQWYLEARRQGDSREILEKKVEEFCLRAIQHRATHLGEPAPSAIEAEVVAITLDMYELALSQSDIA
jgi:hypothetical protein